MNGQLGPDEEAKVADLLRGNAEARAFLRAVAEQAVVVADVERLDQHKPQTAKVVTPVFRPWKWAVAAAAAFVLLSAFVIATTPPRHTAKVSAILGPCQYIAADGKVRDEVKVGTVLRVGDTIRTRSSSAWVKLDLNGGSLMTIAGRSRLRLLNVDGRRGFQLANGNLWATVAQSAGAKPVSIQTPTATVEAKVAQFDVESSLHVVDRAGEQRDGKRHAAGRRPSAGRCGGSPGRCLPKAQPAVRRDAPARTGQRVELPPDRQFRGGVRQMAAAG